MPQDSEKRFHSIMDKLFQNAQATPNSNSTSSPSSSSPSVVQLSRGKKRSYSSSALVVGELRSKGDVIEALQKHSSASAGSSDAPSCRPWERGDLLKRLTTFKSMTWFGKPKVVNAINCARRGWINVDMDTIACESCGSRLLFSTPSSWNQQQVEKAALVFSLKLDNGHKLLCPWIDNACDEALAQFPPTPPPILVNRFRERCSMLLHVSALPVISSSFLKWMKSSHLKQFLEESFLQEFGDDSLSKSEIEHIRDGHDSDTAKVYNQALKLISLFGWEPRSLPYVVDCKTGSDQSLKISTILDPRPAVNLHTAATKENNRIAEISSELHSQPNSVVLDCRLCGASVGLWTFHTASRPVEIIRLVGPTEMNSESGTHDSGNKNFFINHAGIGNVGASKESISNLTSTIAGGPTPAHQNFKATITLPVIGQNLRARLFNDEKFSDHMYNDQEMAPADSLDKNLLQDSETNEYTQQIDQPEDIRSFQNQKLDRGCSTTGHDQTPLLEGTSVTEQGTFRESGLNGSIEETQVKITDIVPVQKNESLENAENSGQLDSGNKAVDLHPGPSSVENSLTTTDAVMITSSECSEKELSFVVFDMCDSQQVSENNSNSKETSLVSDKCDPQRVSENTSNSKETSGVSDKCDSQQVSEHTSNSKETSVVSDKCDSQQVLENTSNSKETCFVSDKCDSQQVSENTSNSKETSVVFDKRDSQQVSENTSNSKEISSGNLQVPPSLVDTNKDITGEKESMKDKLGTDNHPTSGNQDPEGGDAKDQAHSVNGGANGGENYPKGAPSDDVMEFDPIRQHRPFCPWTATGSVAPGWKQTLTALQRDKSSSPHSPKNSPSASLIKVDDPVRSVRELFTSSAKKLKSSLVSNENTKH